MEIPKRVADDDEEYQDEEEDEFDDVEVPAPQRLPTKARPVPAANPEPAPVARPRGRPRLDQGQSTAQSQAQPQQVKKAEEEFVDFNQEEVYGTRNSLNEIVALYPREFSWLRPIITQLMNRLDKIEQSIARS